MPPNYFPLRWESTGDQWWYASPIDWAAANGHYDLVRELLHLDTNLLIKLTSLRRIRRLETVWDDEEQFEDVAKCRSHIAQKLLLECETNKGHNSLIRAGYGGWLLYTAASAGDLSFVRKLLERDPFLVFGEGEYGVTDLFYAAARSKNSEVFRVLLGFSISPGTFGCNNGELEDQLKEIPLNFKWEMMNRAVHAAARGGNLELLKELIAGDCSDVLGYRDLQGSTILHTAAGRGRVEVLKDILVFYDIRTTTDNQGNTALHVAAYRGYLAVVELLVLESPSVSSSTNNYGDTFLHMAVAGFRTPGFRRVDRQIELMKKLVSGKIMIMADIINVRNNDGRTALHMAVIENIQSDMVELLMTVRSINLNIRDSDGLTPLDLLRQRPQSASSEILIKRLISAGGISNCHDHVARTALVSHLKTKGIGSSPGTSFGIPDAEIFLYTGIDASDASHDPGSVEFSTCSSELSRFGSASEYNSLDKKKMSSVNHAARRLKILLRWPRKKERKSNSPKSEYNDDDDDEDSIESYKISSDWEENPIPLRQRYSKLSSLPNNKRTFSIWSDLPSPSTKRKFAAGLMHGVIRAVPPQVSILTGLPSSTFSGSSMSSSSSIHQEKSNGNSKMNRKNPSLNKRLMNQYFCFGAQGIAVEDSNSCTVPNQRYKHSISSLTA